MIYKGKTATKKAPSEFYYFMQVHDIKRKNSDLKNFPVKAQKRETINQKQCENIDYCDNILIRGDNNGY